ncbi:hypothetical protein A7P25_28835 [Achromobacter xylosoxidans]|nr:hypothetical protein A7P25_28835 [Achromobacter xylosoxidans]
MLFLVYRFQLMFREFLMKCFSLLKHGTMQQLIIKKQLSLLLNSKLISSVLMMWHLTFQH